MKITKNSTIAMCHGVYATLLACVLFVVIYIEFKDPTLSSIQFMLLCLGCVLLLLLNVFAMQAVQKSTPHSRLFSRVMAVLMLPNIPIGLVLGGLILYKSTDQYWQG